MLKLPFLRIMKFIKGIFVMFFLFDAFIFFSLDDMIKK